jgi:hypothetical protein
MCPSCGSAKVTHILFGSPVNPAAEPEWVRFGGCVRQVRRELAAWLVLAVIAFNLTRAAATLTGPKLAKSTTPTIRRKLITIPARVATSARRVTLHLPAHWPWEQAWTELFTRVCGPPAPTA